MPENRSTSGTSPSSPSACRYFDDAGDLEVVGARQRQVDLGDAGEALDHRAALHPQERLERVATNARASPNRSTSQAGLVGLVVAAPLRLDPHLAAQRDRVHRRAGRLRDPQPRGQLRRRGVRLGDDVDDRELVAASWSPVGIRVAHRAAPCVRHRSKKSSIAARASVPPSKPRHSHPQSCRPARSRRRSAPGGTEHRRVSGRRRAAAAPRRRGAAARAAGWRRRRCSHASSGELGLGGPGRAGVEGDDPTLHGVVEEERQADRDLQRVPLGRAQREVGEREVAVGHRAVAQLGVLGGEQQVAAAAGAHQRAALEVDHVGVLVADRPRRTSRTARPAGGAGRVAVIRRSAARGSARRAGSRRLMPGRSHRRPPTEPRPQAPSRTSSGSGSRCRSGSSSSPAPARRTS